MGYEIPRVTKCCCCIPLRLASLIIGYISIFASSLTIAFASWSIYKVHDYVDHNNHVPTPEHPPQEVTHMALSLYISFGYYILVFLFGAILGLILVIGVHLGKTKLMRIYCNATLFLFAMGLALVVLTCVFMGFLATLPILKWCFTLLCCFVVVRSAYLDIEEQNKPSIQEMETLYITQHPPPLVV